MMNEGDGWIFREAGEGIYGSYAVRYGRLQYMWKVPGTEEFHTGFIHGNEASRLDLRGDKVIYSGGKSKPVNACIIDQMWDIVLLAGAGCSEPLETGRKWSVGFAGRSFMLTVVGSETVSVPIGTYVAMKMEADIISEVKNPAAPGGVEPMTYRTTYWYSSETRSLVKLERKLVDPTGKRKGESTEELDWYSYPWSHQTKAAK